VFGWLRANPFCAVENREAIAPKKLVSRFFAAVHAPVSGSVVALQMPASSRFG
jgi:hypothetical protein